jgi:hypothetical protein
LKFEATIRQAEGSTATGIEIPDEVMAALGAGKKPPVRLTVNGYAYLSTVATVDGRSMVGFSADHRAASGLHGGDTVEVDIEVDTEPRTVELPDDFRRALEADSPAMATFNKLSNSNKGYHVSQVTGTKNPETRQRRIEKSIAALHDGKPR